MDQSPKSYKQTAPKSAKFCVGVSWKSNAMQAGQLSTGANPLTTP